MNVRVVTMRREQSQFNNSTWMRDRVRLADLASIGIFPASSCIAVESPPRVAARIAAAVLALRALHIGSSSSKCAPNSNSSEENATTSAFALSPRFGRVSRFHCKARMMRMIEESAVCSLRARTIAIAIESRQSISHTSHVAGHVQRIRNTANYELRSLSRKQQNARSTTFRNQQSWSTIEQTYEKVGDAGAVVQNQRTRSRCSPRSVGRSV